MRDRKKQINLYNSIALHSFNIKRVCSYHAITYMLDILVFTLSTPKNRKLLNRFELTIINGLERKGQQTCHTNPYN